MLARMQFAVCADADRYALATGAETVEVWKLPASSGSEPASEPQCEIETERSAIRGLAFLGPRTVLTAHELGELAVWRLPDRQGEEDEQLPAETEADGESDGEQQTDLARRDRAPDAEEIPTAELLGSREFDLEIAAFRARTRGGSTADRIAIGDRSGRLLVGAVDDETSDLTWGLSDAHETDVTSLAFAPRSERLATGGRDNSIAVWSINPSDFEPRDSKPDDETSSETETEGDAGEDEGATPSDESDELLSEFPAVPRRLTLEGSKGWPLAIEFSGDGTRIASTALDNALYLWDPRAEEPLQAVVNRHDNWVTELAWSPDDSRVATGSWDTTIGLFQASGLAPEYRFDAHTDFVSGLAFVSEPARLVSASYDGTIAVWDWASGELVDRIEAHADWIEGCLSLDGSRVLTVSSEHIVRIWDIETGERLAEIGNAAVEGFDLGREVDFSDYVDVPELSSAALGEREQSRVTMDAVHGMAPPDQTDGRSTSGSNTAVGLLEDAIETSLQDQATAELGEGESDDDTGLLESRLEQPDADADSADDSKLPEPESAEVPEPADEDEVEAAFSEISEVELEDLKTKRETASPADSSDAETGSESASDSPEDIDQFGESIDERVGDATLDVPDEIDTDREAESLEESTGVGQAGPSDETEAGEDQPEVSSLGDQPSPQLGPPVDEGRGGAGRNSSSGPTTSDDGRKTDASPKLGAPADDDRSDRRDDVGGDTLSGGVPNDAESTQFGLGPAGDTSPTTNPGPGQEGDDGDGDGADEAPETAGEEDSEPTAQELKQKFRKLQDSEPDSSSQSQSD